MAFFSRKEKRELRKLSRIQRTGSTGVFSGDLEEVRSGNISYIAFTLTSINAASIQNNKVILSNGICTVWKRKAEIDDGYSGLPSEKAAGTELVPDRYDNGKCFKIRAWNASKEAIPACTYVKVSQDVSGDLYIVEVFSTQSTTTSTTKPCSSKRCKWIWNPSTNKWVLDKNECTTTSTSTSTSTTSSGSTTTTEYCGCPTTTTKPPKCECTYPDFCCDNGECGPTNTEICTYTRCSRNPPKSKVNCNTTTSSTTTSTSTSETTTTSEPTTTLEPTTTSETTSTTSSAPTTTTDDGTECGQCGWRVNALGKIENQFFNCRGDCICPIPVDGNPCSETVLDCVSRPIPTTPPISCHYDCKYVCDPEKGWLLAYMGCPFGCTCKPPTGDCDECGADTYVQCTPISGDDDDDSTTTSETTTTSEPTTTLEPTTTSSSTTSTTPECQDKKCFWKCKNNEWELKTKQCPENCDCYPPNEGCIGDCATAKTNCLPGSTTTSSSTTSTTWACYFYQCTSEGVFERDGIACVSDDSLGPQRNCANFCLQNVWTPELCGLCCDTQAGFYCGEYDSYLQGTQCIDNATTTTETSSTTTQSPTTQSSSTEPPTTQSPSTEPPTTEPPTTQSPSTEPPSTTS
jgi:hypothetical protein